MYVLFIHFSFRNLKNNKKVTCKLFKKYADVTVYTDVTVYADVLIHEYFIFRLCVVKRVETIKPKLIFYLVEINFFLINFLFSCMRRKTTVK